MSTKTTIDEQWSESRRGAWAGRGFHFQHLVTVLLILRQWAGEVPHGGIVPEGLDDCVLEQPGYGVWIQIKSRHEGVFRAKEASDILVNAQKKIENLKTDERFRVIVCFEQNVVGEKLADFAAISDPRRGPYVRCTAPAEQSVQLVCDTLGCAEMVAEAVVHDLYQMVADAASENASKPFADRTRLTVTEIERRIQERLEATDSSLIDKAVLAGALRVIGFNSPIDEPGFYRGVKVKVGHVAAGLAVGRKDDVERAIKSLRGGRRLLIRGPSGVGKSALLWLTVHNLADQVRWYEVNPLSAASAAPAILHFLNARRPTQSSPVGLAFDEVSSKNAELWDALAQAVSTLPNTYLLGSVRQEDLALLRDHDEITTQEAQLDSGLAETIWQSLSEQGHTSWDYWQEPFERSEGLTLEYTHILTAGDRLASIISGQIKERERDGRDTELAIIRSTSVATQFGGEIEVDALIDRLKIPKPEAMRLLKRLLDEHLVREKRPGILGGLHTLRSEALANASHDELVFRREESAWVAIGSATIETMPSVVRGLFASGSEEQLSARIERAAEVLRESDRAIVWAGILTGLGLATLDRAALSFISCLEKHGVKRAQWSLSALFFLVDEDPSAFEKFDSLKPLKNAIDEYQRLEIMDLRQECLAHFSQGIEAPTCTTLSDANALLSCMVPIARGEPLDLVFKPSFVELPEVAINELIDMLATAHVISKDLAVAFVNAFGGEEAVLHWFADQTPWVSLPQIDENGLHGRTTRATFYLLANHFEETPNDAAVAVCEALMALTPMSDAAACQIVRPDGSPHLIFGQDCWSKEMPRKNLPSKAQVAWNAAFHQLIQANAQRDTLTAYARKMGDLTVRTEKIFRKFTEKWIGGKMAPVADAVAAEINDIDETVNDLAFAEVKVSKGLLNKPQVERTKADLLGPLLTDILKNIPRQLNRIELGASLKAEATFAGGLAKRAREHRESRIWRVHPKPPFDALENLETRLYDLSAILHDWHHISDESRISQTYNLAKRAGTNRKLHSVARRARLSAQRHLDDRLALLEAEISKLGRSAVCLTRPIQDPGSHYWPSVEVAIVVTIENFEALATYIDDCLPIAQTMLDREWRYVFAPAIQGKVLASLAVAPAMDTILPDRSFAQNWSSHLDQPLSDTDVSDQLEKGLGACSQISGMLCALRLDNLHPDEDSVLGQLNDTYQEAQASLDKACDGHPQSEEFAFAATLLRKQYQRLASELSDVQSGRTPQDWLWAEDIIAVDGDQPSDNIVKRGLAIMQLRQAECALQSEADQ
jgi:hypothetical protein